MKQLHLGCGDLRIDGFINIDIRETPATDIVMDVTDLGAFSDESVDLVYSSHCLEHFGFREVPDILSEWHRVLKRGGTLVIRVPDFDILINSYLKYPDTALFQELGLFGIKGYRGKIMRLVSYLLRGKGSKDVSFFKRISRLYRSLFIPRKRKLTPGLLGSLLGGQDYPENFHKSFFNESYLSDLLSNAGFVNIKRVSQDKYPYDWHNASLDLESTKA